MGFDPQSCSYPPPNRRYPSSKDDEEAVDRVCGQFQPAPSEVGPPISEPLSIDRV
mgnify:CR=1 FL=1